MPKYVNVYKKGISCDMAHTPSSVWNLKNKLKMNCWVYISGFSEHSTHFKTHEANTSIPILEIERWLKSNHEKFYRRTTLCFNQKPDMKLIFFVFLKKVSFIKNLVWQKISCQNEFQNFIQTVKINVKFLMFEYSWIYLNN